MSKILSDTELHELLEEIAARGCAEVNQLLVDIDNGADVPEIAHLNDVTQQQVIYELRKIMKVYDSCEVEPE
ncbi:MAG: hypothetical protein OQL16_02855 [Gammaproteobacteria bacterium]|nr:hypothetical protein [Gammaproteobacteria bacterium]